MKSNEHFMQMLLGLSEWETGREQKIGIQELSQLLCCTPRNVKLILRKWEMEGLLQWKAGVGRGNHSRLTIMCDITDFLVTYFQKLLKDGCVGEAIELLHHKNLPERVKRLLQEAWDSQFGFVAEENAAKRRQDVLRIPRDRPFSTIDPAFVSVAAESHFIKQMCDTLVTFDSTIQAFKPQLAYAWESNPEMTAWTFYLRKGVRFHHGRLLTAEDVIYTVQRLIELDSAYRWQVDDIQWMEQRNDGSITFHLHKPNGFFLHLVSCTGMSILPHDIPFAEQAIVGTGPFRMVEFTEERLVMAAFEDYYRERAILDRVEIWRVPEAGSPKQRYQLLLHTEEHSIEAAQDDSKDMELQEMGCHYLSFNFRKAGIQHDFAFRQAIKHLMDPVQMIHELNKDMYTPAGSFLPQRSQHMPFFPYTIQEAANWLEKSAYQGESVSLFFNDVKKIREEAEWLQNRCQQIGIDLELQSFPKEEYWSSYADKHADMAIMGELLQRDVELGLIEVYKNKCSLVHRFLDDGRRAVVDERLSNIMQLPDSKSRMNTLEIMEDTVKDELWLLFLYHAKRMDRFHPALQGIAVDSFGWIDFSKLWVKSFVTSL